jgi:hypothetical protein
MKTEKFQIGATSLTVILRDEITSWGDQCQWILWVLFTHDFTPHERKSIFKNHPLESAEISLPMNSDPHATN